MSVSSSRCATTQPRRILLRLASPRCIYSASITSLNPQNSAGPSVASCVRACAAHALLRQRHRLGHRLPPRRCPRRARDAFYHHGLPDVILTHSSLSDETLIWLTRFFLFCVCCSLSFVGNDIAALLKHDILYSLLRLFNNSNAAPARQTSRSPSPSFIDKDHALCIHQRTLFPTHTSQRLMKIQHQPPHRALPTHRRLSLVQR